MSDEHAVGRWLPTSVEGFLDGLRWGSIGRFVLVHVLAYAVVGAVFLTLQPSLPAADRVALEFFEPYRPLGTGVLVAQAVRSGLLALVLVPFVDRFVARHPGWVVLFLVLWGLTVVGSIEPMPGSIEGVIYTETTAVAHLAVLVASAVQWGAVAWVFVRWESRVRESEPYPSARPPGIRATLAYVGRFSLLLALVYLAAGVAFFVLQDYATVLATREAFQLYRPLDHPLVQGAALIQLLRGALLALVLLPLYPDVFERERGWLRLFGLLWGLSFLGSPNAISGLAGDLVAAESISGVLFGTAEVTGQLALVSLLLWAWERRAVARRS